MLETAIDDLKRDAEALQPELIALRRDLHMHPEPAYKEVRTAALAAERLCALGMHVTSGIGVTGVVAFLDGAAPGKTVVLRSDMDGVEDQDEAPGREYGSTIAGMNHSCGHDIDLTILLGAAELLAARKGDFSGRVAFVVQPADEPRNGANAMIRDGLWDLVQPDYLLSHHIAPDLEAGKVVAQGGALWSSMDQLTIHVSRAEATPPHITLVVPAIVAALYEAVDKEAASPRYPVSFAVGAVNASQPRRGTAEGTIELRLSTFEPELRSQLLSFINQICKSVASDHQAECRIEVQEATAPIVNDAFVGETVAASVRELAGDAAVVQDFRHSVPDDFSLLQEKAPGAQVLFGTANAARGITAMWHTPEYDADEAMLQLGAQVMAASVLRLLES